MKLPKKLPPAVVEAARQALHRVAPDHWVRDVLGVQPDPWQRDLMRLPAGGQAVVLTGRQAGKSSTACWMAAHVARFRPGSLSIIANPSQRQSAEALRRCRAALLQADVDLISANVFSLETKAGSRILALPGSDDSVRGLSVDGLIIADEAARLTPALISALRPMRARHPGARFLMLSTAWSLGDPFWQVWAGDDPSWLRIKATADVNPRYTAEFLDSERRALGETAYRREYLGEPLGQGASPFTWELFQQATSPTPMPAYPAAPAPAPAEIALPTPFAVSA